MNKTVKILLDEVRNLDNIIARAEQALKRAPEGILRISKSKNSVQYYQRKNAAERNGQYIKKEDRDLACRLAQKDYDMRVLMAAKARRERISKFLNGFSVDEILKLYTSLSKERQALVEPYILPDEQYIAQWEKHKYSGKGFMSDGPEIYTEKGERVRSKSEKIIADKLYMLKIPYRYEQPLILKGLGTVYPDFTVLNKRCRKEYYLEHLGRMDDPEYCEKAIMKIEAYIKNGIFPGEQLILTYETHSHPLNSKVLEELVQKFFV